MSKLQEAADRIRAGGFNAEMDMLEARLAQAEADLDLAVKALELAERKCQMDGASSKVYCRICKCITSLGKHSPTCPFAALSSLPEARDRVREGEPQDGDYLLVGRERWKIDRPEPHSAIAVITPHGVVPVFRVNAERLLSAGVLVLRGDASMQSSEG